MKSPLFIDKYHMLGRFSRLLALLTLSTFLLIIDYLSGPEINVPVLFGIPVALAALMIGWRTSLVFAIVLPVIQMIYTGWWHTSWPYAEILVNTGLRITALTALTFIIFAFVRAYRPPKAQTSPSGTCCFCKQPYQISKNRLTPKIMEGEELSDSDQREEICPTCARLFEEHLKESERIA